MESFKEAIEEIQGFIINRMKGINSRAENQLKRYGKKKLETACERMLAFSSSPSIRTIATLLKNSHEPDQPANENEPVSRYGITRGAAYWKKGGGGHAD